MRRPVGALGGASRLQALMLAVVLSAAPALANSPVADGETSSHGPATSTEEAAAHPDQAPYVTVGNTVSGDPAGAVRKAAEEALTGQTTHDGQMDQGTADPSHEGSDAQEVFPAPDAGHDEKAEGSDAIPAESGDEASAESVDEPRGIAGEVTMDRGDDPHWPEQRGPMPYEVVRSLQFLQDQIARGNAPAIRIQAMLLRRYGQTFSEADADVWKDGRNLRAAVLFVLSGGPPSVLRWVMAKIDLKGDNRTLFEGALAYVQNDVGTAEAKLSGLDLTFVETGLAAQINLVIAQLQQNAKPREALGRLLQVMLIAPGTLLDEAALRMGVMLAEDLGEHQLADRLARQYFDRYAQSAYSGNFRARFAAVYAERPAGTEDDTMATIEDATALIPVDQQLALYLGVGRRALVNGNLVLAAKAANKALSYSGIHEGDRQRALLYETAATLTKRDFAEVSAALAAIDPAKLHPADVKLRSAALDVLAQMRQPLLADAASGPSSTQVVEAAGSSLVLARGNALLDAVKNDLQRATQ